MLCLLTKINHIIITKIFINGFYEQYRLIFCGPVELYGLTFNVMVLNYLVIVHNISDYWHQLCMSRLVKLYVQDWYKSGTFLVDSLILI